MDERDDRLPPSRLRFSGHPADQLWRALDAAGSIAALTLTLPSGAGGGLLARGLAEGSFWVTEDPS